MASRKNLHQTHMEDLVLLGKEGINELNNHILNFTKRLKGREGAYLSTKIDGAPALFCIHNVDGYPETCVGIKSVLNNPNNAYSTPEEIDAKFGDRPSIADKMKYALELAKSIPNGEVWQGDCLFSGQPKEQEINGKHYVTFQPNKILYAFSEDNAGYEKIKNSVFGIAFHTRYIRSGDGWKQSFNVNPEVLTNVPDNFYIMSPALNMNSIDDYDMSAFTNKVKELDKLEEALLSDPAYEELVNNDVFINYWNTFENKFISDKKRTTLDVNTFFNDLKSYVAKVQADAYNKKMSTLKTDRGRINATSKYAEEVEEMENLLDSHKEVLVKLVKTINCASEIKMIMLAGLKKIKHDYSTFATTADSIEEVGDEGIAMSDADGNIVKLVDRSEFSNINRDPKYLAGFQHENLEEDKNVNDKQVYNLVYAKLLDIAEDARLKKKNNHKHYETIREYLKKQYRSNKLSKTMFTKLSRLVDSYDKFKEGLSEDRDIYTDNLLEELNNRRLYLVEGHQYISQGSFEDYLKEDFRYIDSAVTKEFKSTGKVDMRGHKVEGPVDLANLFSIFRDRRYETFRIIFVRNNEIVGTDAITSRLPGISVIYKYHKSDNDIQAINHTFVDLKTKFNRLNADGYYLFHNHPSGQSLYSDQDIKATRLFVSNLPGFLGHIIEGDEKFTFIDKNGNIETYDLDDKLEPLQSLGRINSREGIARQASHYAFDDNVSLIFYVTSAGDIRAVQEVDNYEFKEKSVANYIVNQKKENGCSEVFLVTKNPRLLDKLGDLTITKVFRDIIAITDSGLVLSYNSLSTIPANVYNGIIKSYSEAFDVKNLEHNSDTNTDRDPAVKATKAYHNMKLKKLKPGQMIVSSLDLDEKIVKKGSEWQVQSEKGRNMGTYDTKKEAEKRLKQVHYFKYKNEDLNEDANVDFTISVVTTFSGLNEDIISGNIEGSDADNLIEYYEFIDDVEDLIKKNGTIIESNPTTAISSLSEYFNFYINDSEGNKVSGLISLRVSDHDETRKGTYIQRIKANKLDANNKLISITVNSKKFESYDQALKHIKDIISNETGVELKESMKLNKLILDEDLELDETIINRIQKVIEDVKADQGPFKMTWTNDTGVVNAEGIGISEKYSFIIAPSTSSTTSLKMSEIVDELDDKLSDEFTESTITVERKKMDSTGYLHKIVIRKFHSSEKLNAFDDLDNFEEDYEVNSPEAKHINSIIYKLVNRLRDMNYKVMSRTLFHTGKHDIGVKGTKETAQKLYLFFKNMLKKEGIDTHVTLERCTDNVYDYNITVFFPNEKDKGRLLAMRDLEDELDESSFGSLDD